MRSSVEVSCASPPIRNTVRGEVEACRLLPRRALEIKAHALVRECHCLLFGRQIDCGRSRDQRLRITEEAQADCAFWPSDSEFSPDADIASSDPPNATRRVEERVRRHPAKVATSTRLTSP
jgi:hypothetical protein